MGKYADVALKAVLLIQGGVTDPAQAWDEAAALIFPTQPASRVKVCPRSAFLGLCEAGLVKGVCRSQYTKSRKNKDYALRAVEALRRSANPDPVELWQSVLAGQQKKPNSQMDVVVALWEAGHINVLNEATR